MKDHAAGRIESGWERLSTGIKMLLILTLGLLPLGIVAVLASIDNARENRAEAGVEAEAILAVHAQRYRAAIARNTVVIRAAHDAIAEASDPGPICRRTLDRLALPPNLRGRYVLYGAEGQPACATEGFVPPPVQAARGEGVRIVLSEDGNFLQSFFYAPGGEVEGVAEFRREALAAAVDTPRAAGDFALELVQGTRTIALRTGSRGDRGTKVSAAIVFANGQYALRIRNASPSATLSELLVILTPVLMWLWASVVGWVLVQRLLLKPLAGIQEVIAAYRPGDQELDLPILRSPAREIGALGAAFVQVTRTVARHEAELEAALGRQTRLVREVHHRVKNNLQVVASLLNLHSRGSPNEEVAAAYASIQRRVDALAVVHRNHFAELEDNRGVALKALITELAANLRATAPASATAMQIRLDIAPCHTGQDAAVSVAFFVTEVVEFGMLCGASLVSIVLDAEEAGVARLAIEADALAGEPDCDDALIDRFARIVTGLARQLRSPLDHDTARGRYSVRVPVVPRTET